MAKWSRPGDKVIQMSKFENVAVEKNANIYFDGNVTSRTIQFDSGEIKTLGIMLPGVYRFNTGKRELMEIQSGDVEVLLPDCTEWQHFSKGDHFYVEANASFDIKVKDITDYCCSFLDAE